LNQSRELSQSHSL
jgi:RNase H-fold protein (predicted Holliday junction resolvase)